MAIQLTLATNGFLTFPAGTPVSGGGTTIVETHGVISAMTDAALAAKFPETTGAQPDDVIWVGTDPENYVQYRMKQGSTNAQQAASWELAPSAAGAGVSTLRVVPASLTLSAGGFIQESPLPSELQTLAPFGDRSSVYLVQQSSGEWRLGDFAQFDFPAGNVAGLFFRASDPAIAAPTMIWDDTANRGWVLKPDGNRYPMGGGSVTTGGAEIVETHGAISDFTDTALAVKFPNASDAQSGDLIWANGLRYRMKLGATDARLADSWETDGSPISQPQIITYNDPALTSQALTYSRTYYVDLRGTTPTNRLTLQLPGSESTSQTMEIKIRDIPTGTFGQGYLTLQALPDGANPIQILAPEGLTTDSLANVSERNLAGSEIYLARAPGQTQWMLSLRQSTASDRTWVGVEGNAPSPAQADFWIVADADPGEVRFYSPAEEIWRTL